jgi:hypothetical protein
VSKLIPLVLGVIFFTIFAWDIENDRDIITWFWLLISQLFFTEWIVQHIKENKPDSKLDSEKQTDTD